MERTCPYCHGAVVAVVDTKGQTVILCSQCKQPVPEDPVLVEQFESGKGHGS
jgi:uncharacterized protein YbaR (Trm112 family)